MKPAQSGRTQSTSSISLSRLDPGLACLVIIARLNGIHLDPAQINHQFGQPEYLNTTELLRAAKMTGLKARSRKVDWKQLQATHLPAIIGFKDGSHAVLAKISDQQALLHMPGEKRAETVSQDFFMEHWNHSLIEVSRGTQTRISEDFGFSWFLRTMRKYSRVMHEVVIASAFIQVFALVSPLVFMLVIDKVLSHRSLSTLDVLVFALAAISLFEIVLTGMRSYLLSHTSHRVDVELGARLFRHLMSLPMSWFASRQVGDTVARLRELDVVRQFITGSAITLLLDLVFTVVFLAVMFLFSPVLTMIVITAIPLYFLISFLMTPLIRGRLNDKFSIYAENQSFAVEAVAGIETVKSSATEPHWQRQWEDKLASYVGTSFRSGHYSALANQAVSFVSKCVIVLLLYLGAGMVMNGELTVGQLIAFNMLAARVNAPILRIAQLWQEFQQVRVSLQKLGDIFDAPAEVVYRPGKTALPGIKGRVAFEHVGFRYRPDLPEALNDVSFELAPGDVVGIVGASGSGKTTLTKLLLRLYPPEHGRILIDGVDLGMVDASWLRRQIGVVSQDTLLFNRSVLENIALASPGIGMDAVVEAAKLAGGHDFILELPDGYDTVIGERGGMLSGGQRQRVAIARALVTDPRLLIFDEATSALDTESEMVIQHNLRRISKGRTVIIIAHRLSTLFSVDRILTLERGRLVENGTPGQLLANPGRFSSLHSLQGERHAFV